MKKLLAPFLIAAIILTALMLKGKLAHEKFDSEKWKTANPDLEESMSLRWDMMNDLRNTHQLVGMKKQEIIKLLGDGGDSCSSEFHYYLGYSGSGINTGHLVISFNDRDIVSKIRVWQG